MLVLEKQRDDLGQLNNSQLIHKSYGIITLVTIGKYWLVIQYSLLGGLTADI
jgi:hypothetical protein